MSEYINENDQSFEDFWGSLEMLDPSWAEIFQTAQENIHAKPSNMPEGVWTARHGSLPNQMGAAITEDAQNLWRTQEAMKQNYMQGMDMFRQGYDTLAEKTREVASGVKDFGQEVWNMFLGAGQEQKDKSLEGLAAYEDRITGVEEATAAKANKFDELAQTLYARSDEQFKKWSDIAADQWEGAQDTLKDNRKKFDKWSDKAANFLNSGVAHAKAAAAAFKQNVWQSVVARVDSMNARRDAEIANVRANTYGAPEVQMAAISQIAGKYIGEIFRVHTESTNTAYQFALQADLAVTNVIHQAAAGFTGLANAFTGYANQEYQFLANSFDRYNNVMGKAFADRERLTREGMGMEMASHQTRLEGAREMAMLTKDVLNETKGIFGNYLNTIGMAVQATTPILARAGEIELQAVAYEGQGAIQTAEWLKGLPHTYISTFDMLQQYSQQLMAWAGTPRSGLNPYDIEGMQLMGVGPYGTGGYVEPYYEA